jgi:hypothetical protein
MLLDEPAIGCQPKSQVFDKLRLKERFALTGGGAIYAVSSSPSSSPVPKPTLARF